MMRYLSFIGAVLLCLTGCSEKKSKAPPKSPKIDPETAMRRHVEITENGIFADFMSSISSHKDEAAFQLLHPKLRTGWTQERFTDDWTSIRDQIGGDWSPSATGSFSGSSPQGPYQQATYRLSTDWKSISSVELVSMQTDDETRLVKVHVRVPDEKPPRKDTQELMAQFVTSMASRDFDSASQLFSPASRTRFPPLLLEQIAPILGDSVNATAREQYRLCANTVWYEAVRLVPNDEPATFVEIIISAGSEAPEIVSLSFKGRISK